MGTTKVRFCRFARFYNEATVASRKRVSILPWHGAIRQGLRHKAYRPKPASARALIAQYAYTVRGDTLDTRTEGARDTLRIESRRDVVLTCNDVATYASPEGHGTRDPAVKSRAVPKPSSNSRPVLCLRDVRYLYRTERELIAATVPARQT